MSAQLALDYQGHPEREHPFRGKVYRKRLAFTMIVAHAEQFRGDFMTWLVDNWHVFLAFELEADRVWGRGRTHYSARTIGEYLRHETALREGPNELGFKVNDHWWPDLGRLYMLLHPDRAQFFERRVGQSARRSA